ncbi:hypothetical protein N431DRAFT_36269 [Stipitochalara longipes BDJ]|nr:hypothetical protein N431DRAFT_36269 [Stipitochalara longipes BDJ]
MCKDKAGGYQEPGIFSMYNISHCELKSAKATGSRRIERPRDFPVKHAIERTSLSKFLEGGGLDGHPHPLCTADFGHLQVEGRRAMFRNAANVPSLISRKVCREQVLRVHSTLTGYLVLLTFPYRCLSETAFPTALVLQGWAPMAPGGWSSVERHAAV